MAFRGICLVVTTSTSNIRVVPDHKSTLPRPRRGLHFEISNAMKKSKTTKLLTSYHNPRQPGSLGGVTSFARTLKLPVKKVREVLQKDLGYTLHKPRRRRFPTLPVLVFSIDEQWVVDLVEVQNISKYNKGMRYLLMVIDAFSKYAWVEPIKSKTGKAVSEAFEKILKRARRKPINPSTHQPTDRRW